MMIVELPESYLALVLSDAKSAPTREECDKLRLETAQYLTSQLKHNFPSLKKFSLEFSSTEFESEKPAPRFNLYFEVKAEAQFVGGPPKANEIFDKFVSTFDRDYLLQVARKMHLTPLASAVEVEARRLKQPTAGGAVKAPPFYMAFVCTEEPITEPSKKEKNALLKILQTEAVRLLCEAFPEDFEEVSLKITQTAIGAAAGKPEAKYNLYVQFEAVAIFHQNAPGPMEIFRIVSGCLSSDFPMKIVGIGECFALMTQLVMRLCVFVEAPLLEEEDGEGQGEGDKERLIVKVRLEFFVALVVRGLQAFPSRQQLQELDQLIQCFFSEMLARSFPKDFVDMALQPNPEYEAGLPLPRFNMLHQYNATLQFYDPAPSDGLKILQTIMKSNIPTLFEKIKGLSSPWNEVAEATMGKAVEKPATEQVFGGKLEIETNEEIKDDVVAPKPVKPVTQPEKAVNLIPKESRKKAKKEAPKPKPVRRIVEKTITVGTSDVFAAFTIPDCATEPLRREYEALAKATQIFYSSHLKQKFDSFQDVRVRVSKTYFGKNKPNELYNVYLEWDIEAKFKAGMMSTSPPDRYKLCRALVETDLKLYLIEHVRSLVGTPFEEVVGMYTEQINS